MSLINVLPYDTWRHEELPIFIRSSALNEAVDRVNEDQMALISSRSWRVVERHVDASDSPRRLIAIGRRKPHDREIVAHDRRLIDGPRSSCDRGHQSPFHQIKRPAFLVGIPL